MTAQRLSLAEIVEFMESFQVPDGVGWADLMSGLGEGLNDGGVEVDPARIVTMGEAGGWTVRGGVWLPPGSGPHPVVLHLHGGGWVSGNHLSHRPFDAELARAGYVVVSVDYRRAPKHRFPAPFDDCVSALQWVHEHTAELNGDPDAIAILGDSAGANLAAGVLAAGRGAVPVAAAVLVFGIYDYHRALPVSGRMTGGTEPATQAYLPVDAFEELRGDPRVSPIHSTKGWPPVYLAAGTRDPLLDETRFLHSRLVADGVEHTYHEIGGAPHSYVQLRAHPAFAEGFGAITAFLGRHLRDGGLPAGASR